MNPIFHLFLHSGLMLTAQAITLQHWKTKNLGYAIPDWSMNLTYVPKENIESAKTIPGHAKPDQIKMRKEAHGSSSNSFTPDCTDPTTPDICGIQDTFGGMSQTEILAGIADLSGSVDATTLCFNMQGIYSCLKTADYSSSKILPYYQLFIALKNLITYTNQQDPNGFPHQAPTLTYLTSNFDSCEDAVTGVSLGVNTLGTYAGTMCNFMQISCSMFLTSNLASNLQGTVAEINNFIVATKHLCNYYSSSIYLDCSAIQTSNCGNNAPTDRQSVVLHVLLDPTFQVQEVHCQELARFILRVRQ
jgi:hypothetical protein